ncbi:MAG: ABC transporter permease subunit [Sulfolobales archaeon]|nr:ABC transporter permease subunit [Sulfolobales archaeon]MCX8198934.1 ABC transporter permease subunit [Sulfolobales archaeon]MDW8169912.1 ABC transporter permease subunit [Desulfurococcaceae archaeon]
MFRSYFIRKLKNYLMLSLAIFVSVLAVIPLFSMLYMVIVEGGKVLLDAGLSFITELPPTPLSSSIGGVAPALLGSVLASTLAIAISGPIAFLVAFFVTEFKNSSFSKISEVVVRSFSGIPSIIVSMFVYSTVVMRMGTQSLFAGSLSLAIVALPYAYVYFTSAMKSIPESLREAAMSLGMSRFKALRYVYVGVSKKYILTGILMSYIKAFGETAPLLFTMGFLMNSVFAGFLQPSNALPILVFIYALSPYEVFHKVAWGATLLLIIIYLVLFSLARSLLKGVKL